MFANLFQPALFFSPCRRNRHCFFDAVEVLPKVQGKVNTEIANAALTKAWSCIAGNTIDTRFGKTPCSCRYLDIFVVLDLQQGHSHFTCQELSNR